MVVPLLPLVISKTRCRGTCSVQPHVIVKLRIRRTQKPVELLPVTESPSLFSHAQATALPTSADATTVKSMPALIFFLLFDLTVAGVELPRLFVRPGHVFAPHKLKAQTGVEFEAGRFVQVDRPSPKEKNPHAGTASHCHGFPLPPAGGLVLATNDLFCCCCFTAIILQIPFVDSKARNLQQCRPPRHSTQALPAAMY